VCFFYQIRSKINRVEAATDLVNPFHHPHHHRHYNPMEAGIVAAELQAERYREMTEFERLRQMELAASMGRGIPPAGGAYPYCPPAPGYMVGNVCVSNHVIIRIVKYRCRS
jgi:hypothetical protein